MTARESTSVTAARTVGAAQLIIGALLTGRPKAIARAAAGRREVPPGWLVQVLGVRSIVQGVLVVAMPTRSVLHTAAGVDVAHAASMLPVLAVVPHYRRVAAVSASAAILSAAAELWSARRKR